MNVRALRHSVALAKTLNYSKAAADLGISQPVLSRSIKDFETQEGVLLFDRDRGGVSLTPLGKTFVDRAKLLLHDFEALADSLQSSARGEAGELSFGIAPMPAKSLLAPSLSELIRLAPELSIASYVRNVDALLALLEAGQIECFISAEAFFPEPHNLKSSFLGYFPVAAMVSSHHPLAKENVVPMEQFPLAMSANVDGVPYLPAALKPYISKERKIIVEDMDVLATVTANSDAIWMASPFVALESLENCHLRIIPPADDQIPQQISMVVYSLNRRTLAPAAVRLRDVVKAEIQQLHRRLKSTVLP